MEMEEVSEFIKYQPINDSDWQIVASKLYEFQKSKSEEKQNAYASSLATFLVNKIEAFIIAKFKANRNIFIHKKVTVLALPDLFKYYAVINKRDWLRNCNIMKEIVEYVENAQNVLEPREFDVNALNTIVAIFKEYYDTLLSEARTINRSSTIHIYNKSKGELTHRFSGQLNYAETVQETLQTEVLDHLFLNGKSSTVFLKDSASPIEFASKTYGGSSGRVLKFCLKKHMNEVEIRIPFSIRLSYSSECISLNEQMTKNASDSVDDAIMKSQPSRVESDVVKILNEIMNKNDILYKNRPEKSQYHLDIAVRTYYNMSKYRVHNVFLGEVNHNLIYPSNIFFHNQRQTPNIEHKMTVFYVRKTIADEMWNEFVNNWNCRSRVNQGTILVSEWANSGDIYDWLREFYIEMWSLQDYNPVHTQERLTAFVTSLFTIVRQIMFALIVVQEEYPFFRHNDLHRGNVLVRRTDKSPSYIFQAVPTLSSSDNMIEETVVTHQGEEDSKDTPNSFKVMLGDGSLHAILHDFDMSCGHIARRSEEARDICISHTGKDYSISVIQKMIQERHLQGFWSFEYGNSFVTLVKKNADELNLLDGAVDTFISDFSEYMSQTGANNKIHDFHDGIIAHFKHPINDIILFTKSIVCFFNEHVTIKNNAQQWRNVSVYNDYLKMVNHVTATFQAIIPSQDYKNIPYHNKIYETSNYAELYSDPQTKSLKSLLYYFQEYEKNHPFTKNKK